MKETILVILIQLFAVVPNHNVVQIISEPPECIIKYATPITTKDYKKRSVVDIIFIATKSNDSIKTFEIRNTTDSIYYIYSGYISPACYHQPYLHQIDSISKSYYLSLIPTFGNYKMYYQYKNVILSTHQNWYSFIELKPKEYYRFQIRLESSYFSDPKNSISYFDPYKFEEALNSPVNNARRFRNYQGKYIQMAVYRNIAGLCDSRLRIKNGLKLDALQREFFVIKTKFPGFF